MAEAPLPERPPLLGGFGAALAAAAVADQATKLAAIRWLEGSPPMAWLSDFVRIALVPNPGGFMSFGAGLPEDARFWIFAVAVPCSLALVCFWMLRDPLTTPRMAVGLGLVAGGGIGNWLDRVIHGAVTDFVSVGYGILRTGYFNLADVLIFAGIGLLALGLRRSPPETPAPPP